MSNTTQIDLGSVVSLWRYPVKSMMGEELNAAEVARRGLFGDRADALLDSFSGKAVRDRIPQSGRTTTGEDCFARMVEEGGALRDQRPRRRDIVDEALRVPTHTYGR